MIFNSKEVADKSILILEIPEQLTQDNSEGLRQLIKEKVEDGQCNLVLDMTQTRYIDSTGLGAIMSRISFVRSNKGDIRLVVKSEHVKQVLSITNLNKILKSFDSVEEAVNSFE